MQRQPKPIPRLLPWRSRRAMLLCSAMWLLLSGCASRPSAEPPLIARWPEPTPLPASVLLIDTQPSTRTLSEGRQWLQDSQAILNDGMPK